MNILYLYAHPQLASFNAALKNHALEILAQHQQHVKLSDLYADHFNAVASWDDFDSASSNNQYFLAQQNALLTNTLHHDIKREIEKLAWADHVIFQFPLWWFSVPAILKGWLDRVLVKGFAYDAGKVFDNGLLKGKTASIITSTQSPLEAYQINGAHGATMNTFLHSIHHTLRFVGMTPLDPFIVYGAFNLDAEARMLTFTQLTQHLTTQLS